jgi:hypothetical protein
LKDVPGGWEDWKCTLCGKVATDQHLFNKKHQDRVEYWKTDPKDYPDSDDDMYAEVYKMEEAEDNPSSAAASPAGPILTEKFKRAVESRKPPKKLSPYGQPAGISIPAVSEPGRARVAGTPPPTERSQPEALSRPAVSEAGRSRPSSAGPASSAGQTQVPATKTARMMQTILENSVKIQELARQVNVLANQNAEQIVLLERELR